VKKTKRSSVNRQNTDGSTKARVRHAHQRAVRRLGRQAADKPTWKDKLLDYSRLPKDKESRRIETPFGPVKLSPGRGRNDPGYFVTSKMEDYEGQSVGKRYRDYVKALVPEGTNERDVARDLLRALRDEGVTRALNEARTRGPKALKKARKKLFPNIKDSAQRNAAAKLLATMHIAEEQRVPGSSKLGRGALAMVANQREIWVGEQRRPITFKEVFKGKEPLFTMALTPNRMRALYAVDTDKLPKAKKKRKETAQRKEPPGFDDIGKEMSPSSDEEG
jgi:hypothetical protein